MKNLDYSFLPTTQGYFTQGLYGEYLAEKKELENICGLINGKEHLLEHFNKEGRGSYWISDFFDLEHAIKKLNASYWSRVISSAQIIEFMPTDKRHEWHEMIRQCKTPAFEEEIVIATITDLTSKLGHFFTEKVFGVFKNLSPKHATNSPMGFRGKLIINGVVDKYGYSTSRVDYIHDFRSILAQINVLPAPSHSNTRDSIHYAIRGNQFGQWLDFDGGDFRVKLHKIGTAHIEVDPMIAVKLNRILANKFPMAVPTNIKKMEKTYKERTVFNSRIGFSTSDSLMELARRGSKKGNNIEFYISSKREGDEELVKVLQFLGGVLQKTGVMKFDYDPTKAMVEIARSCSYPSVKGYQYYPTKETLADIMIDWAEIEENHTVLEPSAGQGGLCKKLNKEKLTAYELSPVNVSVLKSKGISAEEGDFLTQVINERFDRIVMNPPFSEGRALDHVKRAYELLNEGGLLVACVPSSLRGKQFLDGRTIEWSQSYRDQFDGTSVSVTLMRVRG